MSFKLESVETVESGKKSGVAKIGSINSPEHYTHSQFECIDEMVIVFGAEATATFCKLNAWKYRNRAQYKGHFEEDMAKADWYLAKAKRLMEGDLWESTF